MSVLVYTENWDGKFKKLSYELVSYASKVAEMLGTSAVALSIGKVNDDELKKLGNYGAAKIIAVSDDKLQVLDNLSCIADKCLLSYIHYKLSFWNYDIFIQI